MRYITLEELERRKNILQEKLKQAQEEDKKGCMGNFEENIVKNHLFEVEYLIDYIKMKCEETSKADWCCNCKKFDNCKINRVFSNGVLKQCAFYEEITKEQK